MSNIIVGNFEILIIIFKLLKNFLYIKDDQENYNMKKGKKLCKTENVGSKIQGAIG